MNKEISNHIKKKLEPLVREVITTTDRYYDSPSIVNGSRRQEARQRLEVAIRELAEELVEDKNLSEDEVHNLLDELAV